MSFKPRLLFDIKPKKEKIDRKSPEEIQDWKSLIPGTIEWKYFWKSHPELQDEMLQFKKENECGN
jgi:hypothetical protein